jgi:hypothetical protein
MVKHYELLKLIAITRMKHIELAKIIGVSQQATSRKIKGETEFKHNEMRLITRYFKNLQIKDEYLSKNYPPITMDLIFYEGYDQTEILNFPDKRNYKNKFDNSNNDPNGCA